MKKILSAFLLGAALITAGCEKDKVFLEDQLSGAKSGVGFGSPNNDALTLAVDASETNVTAAINAFLTGGNKGNATITIAVDESIVASYNETNGTEFEAMPSDVYTIPSSISISGGEGTAEASIDIQKLLTYGISFAVGYKITDVTGATDYIQPGNSQGVIIVQVKNKYDGLFQLTVRTDGWAAYGIADGTSDIYPGDITLTTTGGNSVDMASVARGDNLLPAFTSTGGATAFGATSARFIFDVATDKLTDVVNILPDDGRGRKLKINPAVTDSRYDAATGTIYAAFIMSQTGRPDQYFYDTLNYVGSR